jgi:hypothetical protein
MSSLPWMLAPAAGTSRLLLELIVKHTAIPFFSLTVAGACGHRRPRRWRVVVLLIGLLFITTEQAAEGPAREVLGTAPRGGRVGMLHIITWPPYSSFF